MVRAPEKFGNHWGSEMNILNSNLTPRAQVFETCDLYEIEIHFNMDLIDRQFDELKQVKQINED